MSIKHLVYDAQFFNFCHLNGIISLIVYSLYKGYIPVVEVNKDDLTNSFFRWEWFFVQPFESEIKKMKNPIIRDCPDNKGILYIQSLSFAWKKHTILYKITRSFYQKFIILNKHFNDYFSNDKVSTFGSTFPQIGVLMRGTDYAFLKPKGHPILPSVDEVFGKIDKTLEGVNDKRIYLATEDSDVYDLFVKRYGDNVKINKRMFYTKEYNDITDSKSKYICNVHFDRNNDNYYKSIEYLSSLYMLTNIDYFISANCGGACFVVLNRKKNGEYVFNKGLYP